MYKVKFSVSDCLFSVIFGGLIPRDYLFICHDNDRAYQYKGQAYSQIIDTMREHVIANGFTTLVIAEPFSSLTGRKAQGKPVSINLQYRIMKAVSKIVSYIIPAGKTYLYAAIESRFWSYILVHVSPRMVIGIQPCEGLCTAAKKLSIPVSDAQHGIIMNSGIPNSYYRHRSNSEFSLQGIPDRVICWNSVSADYISSLWPSVNNLVAGHPWIDRFRVADPSDKLVAQELANISKKLSPVGSANLALITTQWSPETHKLEIPPHICEAIKISANEGIRWCIKFHPVQIRQTGLKYLARQAALILGPEAWKKMLDVSFCALPAVLRLVSYHVTGSSASTYEASLYGIKTGLWDSRPVTSLWFQNELNNYSAELLPRSPSDVSNRVVTAVLQHKPIHTVKIVF
jgi:hypothetical protein